jgi:perosamine synthetase
VRVQDPLLRARMSALQEGFPVQPRLEYATRVMKFMALLVFARPRSHWVFARAVGLLGRDFDGVVNGAVRGFPGPELFSRIRRRPSRPLLALLRRRLLNFDQRRFEARAHLGERVARLLPSSLVNPGSSALDRTHWLFPVLASDRAHVIASLRRAGFDAATATTSISVVTPPDDRPDLAAHEAQRTLDSVVFLPVYPELGEHEVERLLTALAEADARATE